VLITLQCLTDPVYVAAAVLGPVGVVALARIARPTWRRSGLRLLGVLAGSVACLLFLVRGYARVRAADPNLAQQSHWASYFALLRAFGGVLPTDLKKLFWAGDHPTSMAPAILAVIALGAIVALLRRSRRVRSSLDPAWCHAG